MFVESDCHIDDDWPVRPMHASGRSARTQGYSHHDASSVKILVTANNGQFCAFLIVFSRSK